MQPSRRQARRSRYIRMPASLRSGHSSNHNGSNAVRGQGGKFRSSYAPVMRMLLLILALPSALGARDTYAQQSGVRVTTTFHSDDEGWTVVGDAQGGSGIPTFVENGGSPDGHACATDDFKAFNGIGEHLPHFLGTRLRCIIPIYGLSLNSRVLAI